jgi:hypothetical protein
MQEGEISHSDSWERRITMQMLNFSSKKKKPNISILHPQSNPKFSIFKPQKKT